MQRCGKVLKLRENAIEKYEHYHQNVWPEVLEALHSAGVSNYSIFRYKNWLFSYFELPDEVTIESVGECINNNKVCGNWETIMQQLQEPLPESQENNWWVPMKLVFTMD